MARICLRALCLLSQDSCNFSASLLLYCVIDVLSPAVADCATDMQKEDELANLIKGHGVQPETHTALWACLSRLVNHNDGSPIHHDTLATNVGLSFGAGYDSSGHAVSWALFELAANQKLQVGYTETVTSGHL